MQMVIDITENEWEYLNKLCDNGDILGHYERLIVNGTPLPKGHGDLIDRQSLINNGIEKGFCDWYDEIKYASTIIEAEKEIE